MDAQLQLQQQQLQQQQQQQLYFQNVYTHTPITNNQTPIYGSFQKLNQSQLVLKNTGLLCHQYPSSSLSSIQSIQSIQPSQQDQELFDLLLKQSALVQFDQPIMDCTASFLSSETTFDMSPSSADSSPSFYSSPTCSTASSSPLMMTTPSNFMPESIGMPSSPLTVSQQSIFPFVDLYNHQQQQQQDTTTVFVNMLPETTTPPAQQMSQLLPSQPLPSQMLPSQLLPSPKSPQSDYSEMSDTDSDNSDLVPGSARPSHMSSVPKKVITPKQQQVRNQQRPKKSKKGAIVQSSSLSSSSLSLGEGMTMTMTTSANVAVENGNMNPWTFQMQGTLYRDDETLIKRQHIIVIASCDHESSETYNIENQTSNVDDDGIACIKGIKVTKALRSRSRATQGTANVQKFKLHFVAYDKKGSFLVPIPNCHIVSEDITYLANTKNMLPPDITQVEKITADKLPSNFVTQDADTYIFYCNRIKWGKSNNFSIAFQDPRTQEIVSYVTESDSTRLTPTLKKKVSGFLSVPIEYRNYNLVAGFYSKKDKTTIWSNNK
ncbi:hypothetical protein DFA_01152 [Cavenderia fasciculata]|uniref:Uncharacterized protein n=1 Tax=Cavenderia fasciculata TaxID=261658 RepID=F4PR72_CACFS|nr:uncharacterized protein DFA_01152 [Cavenderia fasciculata]EGG21272.1 hypothetical protein DFA_01152 [Cavenderia fasciculata]|eukprot:XP_004359122.1 hypothetical protein DFA_01152 [Cavenderia fasciculata]